MSRLEQTRFTIKKPEKSGFFFYHNASIYNIDILKNDQKKQNIIKFHIN